MISLTTAARWSSKHPLAARAIISACHIYIISACFALGIITASLGIHIEMSLFWLAFGILVSCSIIYPFRSDYIKYPRPYLFRARRCDIVIVLTSILMVISLTNYEENQAFRNSDFLVVPIVYQTGTTTQQLTFKKVRRTIRKHVRDQLKKVMPEPTKGDKIGLSILLGIALFFGVILITYLSCTIACSGGSALSILVLFGGLGLLTLLGIVGYRRLWSGKKRQANE